MFNAAFVCKCDEVKLGFSPVSDIRYFDVHKTPWMICKSETFAWKYFPGITLRREGGGEEERDIFLKFPFKKQSITSIFRSM